ncbi:hypothetical protein EW145_g7094 [Phellinidium pouzarii]|uniref:Uncharacterized protein n=1 Tax=Phellinidium pouzarii TaxID=167371 RepID=A0A4S4KP61_9AGAM|nr:hypothetical protein EW145_g7094 [Phellinidium pouzarii]
MQNTQRSKQQTAVTFQQAKVKDEAEWEVSKEIKEAWGLLSSPKALSICRQSVTQETSYLPFLFPSLHKSSQSSDSDSEPETPALSLSISGRRTFNKGREVTTSITPEDTSIKAEKIERDSTMDIKDIPVLPTAKGRAIARPGVLHNSRAKRLAELDRAGLLPAGASTSTGVPVLKMISQESTTAVGLDMRRAGNPKDTASSATTSNASLSMEETKGVLDKSPLNFLRPAGVDSPAADAKTVAAAKKAKKRNREEGNTADAESKEGSGRSFATDIGAADTDESQRQIKKKKQKNQTQMTNISPPTT